MSRPSFSSTFKMRRRWYTLSIDTLRGWIIFGCLLALVGAGVMGYRIYEEYSLRGEAATRIEEARQLAARVQQTRGASRFRGEWEAGWRYLQGAQRAFDEDDFRRAANQGLLARNVLLAILDSLDQRGEPGDASFIAVTGRVEFRRGGAGDWQEARNRVALADGDYVRTAGNGSAEIIFADGTIYTVRPNTSFVVSGTGNDDGGGERSIAMDYGWVNLNTVSRPARVTTPSAEARVREESEAYVAYDAASERARFGAFSGSLSVASDGQTVDLGALEETEQVGGRLAAARPLPPRPEPVEPADNLEVDAGRTPELVLAWEPVTEAARYALQISSSHLFADNVIDVTDRTSPRATLGLRGEGNFQWRVAALDRSGARGAWSAPRRFRVSLPEEAPADAPAEAAGDPAADAADRTPPSLELEQITPYGNIFIVRGSTEPGSTVEIADEPASVAADGSFFKTIQLAEEGWSAIEVRARDAWGNQAVKRQHVFVEVP